MAESLAQFFRKHFEAHRDERAYGQRRGYRMEWFSYGRVLEMAAKFRADLEERGIGKGERILLWGENSAEWVAAFVGCAMAGVVVVPMDDGAPADFATRVAAQVEAKLWACSKKHEGELRSGEPCMVLEELSRAAGGVEAAPAGGSPVRDDMLQIVFTSGTTADPKGVVITHGNVLANIAPLEREMQKYLNYERWVHPVRFLNLLPLSHVFGQFLGMFLPPLLGGTVIFQEEMKAADILSTIRREKVSVLVSVPRVLQSLKQKIERDIEGGNRVEEFGRRFKFAEGKHFLRRWWIFRAIRRQFGWKFWAFICGGAALDAETERFWDRLGYAAIQGYGLTETTSLISVNHPFKLGKGSIGKVLPGRDVKLAEDGEILIRGGGIAAGYWRGGARGAADAIADAEGWYGTGDIGALDEEGNLYFKGRKKEVIVTPAGLNIYPEDLEAALRLQPEVKDCVVVGIERGGNAEPCAILIVRGEEEIESVVEQANRTLAEFQRMGMWVRWTDGDFPRTSTQKPKRKLIAEFAAERLADSGGKNAKRRSPVAELIGQIRGRNGGLQADAALDADLGLSSLDRVELISALEDRYQIDLGETSLAAARTIGDVERMLSGEGRPRERFHYPRWALRRPVSWLRWAARYLLMMPAMLVMGWPRVVGRENLRGVEGPLLVVCNHISDVDFAFVRAALPARLSHSLAIATRGEALEDLRSPGPGRGWPGGMYDRMKWALGVALLNLFPLPREAGFRQSFDYAGEAVDRGYSVLVFPEGRHTADGSIRAFRAGIGLLAKNLKVPVLPMKIAGLFELKKAGKKFAAPGAVQVRIGKPIRFVAGEAVEEIASRLQREVEML